MGSLGSQEEGGDGEHGGVRMCICLSSHTGCEGRGMLAHGHDQQASETAR